MNIAKNRASWIVQLWWSWNGKHVGRFIGSTYHRVQWELPRYDSKRSNHFLDQLMIQWWWYPNTSHLHAIIAWSLTNYERHWSEMRSPTNQRSCFPSKYKGFSLFGGKHMNPAPRFPEDSAQTKERHLSVEVEKRSVERHDMALQQRKIWRWLVTPPYDSTSVWRFSITKKVPTLNDKTRLCTACSAVSRSMTAEAFCHFFSSPSHSAKLAAIWDPRGLVNTRTSPDCKASARMISCSMRVVLAHPPRMGQGLKTVWPPETLVPASLQASLKPSIIFLVTISRCSSSIFVDTERIINIVSTRWAPMA